MPKKMLSFLLGMVFLAGCGATPSDSVDREPVAEPSVVIGALTAGAPASESPTVPEPLETEAPKLGNGDADPGEQTPDPEAAAATNYFTFDRDTNISTSGDGTELLYEYTCDTDFYAEDPALDQWVDSVLHQIREDYETNSSNLLKYAQDSLADLGKEYFFSFSNYQEIGIARHDNRMVSLVVLSSVYSGGAHPNLVQTAWNLDMCTRQVLDLEAMLYPGCGEFLAQAVISQVEEKFGGLGAGALVPDYADVIAGSFAPGAMTSYWYLNHHGLVIFFNQYELGPYAAGIIKAEIPYEELHGILREDYFPGNPSELPGDMLLRGDWEGYRKIPITVQTDGERMLIGVEGEVFQIRLSEVYWLENTAIGQKVLFSSNYLTQNQVLELSGLYDEECRTLAVEFSDGSGNNVIYYIHPDELSVRP